MVSLSGAKSKSRDAKRQADIKSIQLALSLYYNDNSVYPKNIYAASTISGKSAPDTGLAGAYLPVVPSDPNSSAACASSSGTGCYKYIAYTAGSSTNCNATTYPPVTYHLGAAMEDTTGAGGLTQDVDADTGSTYVYTGYTACTLSVPGAATFNGNATACTGTTAATTDACYDVAP